MEVGATVMEVAAKEGVATGVVRGAAREGVATGVAKVVWVAREERAVEAVEKVKEAMGKAWRRKMTQRTKQETRYLRRLARSK
jgi:hypothetical protein